MATQHHLPLQNALGPALPSTPNLAHRSKNHSPQKPSPPISGYISTDDALSAFIRQPVIRTRLPRLNPTAESTFTRAVDVRRYLDISPTYPGLVQNMTYHGYTLQKLVEEPLGAVASQLRSALDPKTSNLGYHTRALTTFLSRTPDKNVISFTATLDLSADIMFSSWAKLDCYELDFNLGIRQT
jgi:trichothecene 3-O-acetyltransferase